MDINKTVIKMWHIILLAVFLTFCLPPAMVLAGDTREIKPETLTVDGATVFTKDETGTVTMGTTSGAGWQYLGSEEFTNRNNEVEMIHKLRLDGYNGGPIVADCNLNLELAAGSVNAIGATTSDGLKTENASLGYDYRGSFDKKWWYLNIEGVGDADSRPSLSITGKDYAIHSERDISIENCKLTAVNEPSDPGSGSIACIMSEFYLTITDCEMDLTSSGVTLNCYDGMNISGSKIKAVSGINAFHANNENLVIADTELDVTAPNAALSSRFGGVYLTACTGTISTDCPSGVIGTPARACIRGLNLDKKYVTELKDCNLTLISNAGYQAEGTLSCGISADSDIVIDGGSVSFSGTSYGANSFTSYPDQYTGNIIVQNGAVLSGEEVGTAILRASGAGTVTCGEGTSVNGKILHSSDQMVVLSGIYTVAADEALSEGQTLTIPAGSEVMISENVTLDLSKAAAVILNGKLINHGTVLLNGAVSVNAGVLENLGTVKETEGTALKNDGEISSRCNSLFEVTGNAINAIHDWDEGVITTAPTVTSGGVKTFTCRNDSSHTRTEEIAMLERADYSKVDEAVKKAEALNKNDYKDFSAVDAAVSGVIRDMDVSRQSEVDAMAAAIENAIKGLEKKAVITPGGSESTVTPTKAAGAGGTKTASAVNAKTGDENHMDFWIVLAVAGCGVLITLSTVVIKRKKHN